MKFDCDKGKRRREAKWARRGDWHSFFAILPRRVGPGDCRFFERIERKGYYWPRGGRWVWEYRACQ